MARLTAAALAALSVAMLSAGCGGSSSTTSSKVTATTYVTALCKAVAPFERDVATRSGELNRSKSASFAAEKGKLLSYLGALSDDSSMALSKLKAAGVPQVSGGAAFAHAIDSTFTRLDGALSRSRRLATRLATSNAASFTSGADRLATSVKDSLGRLGSGLSTSSDRALDQAAAKVSACHAL